MLGCFFSYMFNKIKKKINFSSSIYIWFLFFLILFTKFSTISANANTYKVVDLEISKPYDNNFNKESVVDIAFEKAFEQIILKVTTLQKEEINNLINLKNIYGLIESFSIVSRILIKLSGEALMGDMDFGIDLPTPNADMLKKCTLKN